MMVENKKPGTPRAWSAALAGLLLLLALWWWRLELRSTSPATASQTNAPALLAPPKLVSDSATNQAARSVGLQTLASPSNATNLGPNQPAASNVPSLASSTNLLFSPRPPENIYEVQLALARRAISPGSLDGVLGPQTRAALRAFQRQEDLPPTGNVDAATKARLMLTEPPERTYLITSEDLAGLHPLGRTWLTKSQQKRLSYESALELVAELGQAHPNLVRSLNPAVDWNNIFAETAVLIPDVSFPPPRARAAFVRISLTERILEAFDTDTNLLAHFPCSIARLVEKRPLGRLLVELVALDPSYRFDPDLFSDSPEAQKLGRPLILPPGPNNPVGKAWIGLNRPGYGIHGSPKPEEVGRTQSMGCFRLANWNAQYLAQMVQPGTPVLVEP